MREEEFTASMLDTCHHVRFPGGTADTRQLCLLSSTVQARPSASVARILKLAGDRYLRQGPCGETLRDWGSGVEGEEGRGKVRESRRAGERDVERQISASLLFPGISLRTLLHESLPLLSRWEARGGGPTPHPH